LDYRLVVDIIETFNWLVNIVEIDDFQAKVLLADEKIVRFDIPMSDTVLVEICKAPDEPPADLSDVG